MSDFTSRILIVAARTLSRKLESKSGGSEPLDAQSADLLAGIEATTLRRQLQRERGLSRMRAKEISVLKRENRHLMRSKERQGDGVEGSVLTTPLAPTSFQSPSTSISSSSASSSTLQAASAAKAQRLARRVELLEDDLRKVREERSRFQLRQQQLGAELNAKLRKLGEERMRLSEHNVLLRADAEAREAEIKICRAELRKFAAEAHGLRAQLRLAEGDGVGSWTSDLAGASLARMLSLTHASFHVNEGC